MQKIKKIEQTAMQDQHQLSISSHDTWNRMQENISFDFADRQHV